MPRPLRAIGTFQDEHQWCGNRLPQRDPLFTIVACKIPIDHICRLMGRVLRQEVSPAALHCARKCRQALNSRANCAKWMIHADYQNGTTVDVRRVFRRYTVGRSAVTGVKNTGLGMFLLSKDSGLPMRPANFVSRGHGEIASGERGASGRQIIAKRLSLFGRIVLLAPVGACVTSVRRTRPNVMACPYVDPPGGNQ